MANSSLTIPTIDLSPFFKEGDENGQKAAIDSITKASSDFGFFQIVNHGIPSALMNQALDLFKQFFNFPDEEKHKASPNGLAPLPAGYSRQPDHSPDKNEYFLMVSPDSTFNVYASNPPGFREVADEVFLNFMKTGFLIERLINESLGLPPNFLKEFNSDRSGDLMTAIRYFPASENENLGLSEHEDGNCFTFVFQDEVGGLQVRINGEWVPINPSKDAIVVNLGDVIQVLSNKKFKSATHRVVRPQGKDRYSFAFFYSVEGDKWIEPLPKFTKEIGEAPMYRGFFFKDYQALRLRNKTHPPSRPEDVIHISHYAIN